MPRSISLSAFDSTIARTRTGVPPPRSRTDSISTTMRTPPSGSRYNRVHRSPRAVSKVEPIVTSSIDKPTNAPSSNPSAV